MTGLATLAAMVRAGRGLAHKADIASVFERLGLGPADAVRSGDDCAAIPDGDGHLLFAIEGFIESFVARDPWFAGYCGVMVNLADIAAMGGHPIAVVDALWANGEEGAAAVLAGLRAGAATYGVPVVGGHTNTRSDRGQLAVAVLGRANRLLTSFDARPGDVLIAAIDLRGSFREPDPYWDASTGLPAERLRGDLAILPAIAEAGLCRAAKDISMAGLAGTAVMLLEGSGLGGMIDVDRVPRPADVPLDRWLMAFPSFGFLLAATADDVPAILDRFHARDIAAAAIGTADASGVVRLREGADEEAIWDLRERALVGCGPQH